MSRASGSGRPMAHLGACRVRFNTRRLRGRHNMAMIDLMLVEDHERLRPALAAGLEATGQVRVVYACGTGEEAVERSVRRPPHVVLMDVQLAGEQNGIAAAVAIRRE